MTTQALTSAGFWRSYLITARPYLCFLSGVAGLVGLALSPDLSRVALAAGFAVLFVSYGLGQALTDVTQTDTDALSAPYRPLVRGLISPAQVQGVSYVGFGVCGVVLVALNPWTIALTAAGVAGLATYTWFKRRWWAGPLYNSWIVALLPAIGFLCGSEGYQQAVGSRPLAAAMISVLFSYAVFVVLGYLKDISADRATGYTTLPVRFGWRAAVATSGGCALLALIASVALLARSPVFSGSLQPAPFIAIALWLGALGSWGIAHGQLLRTEDEAEAHSGIAWGVRGFMLLHLAEVSALRPALCAPGFALLVLFELSMRVRPERSQI